MNENKINKAKRTEYNKMYWKKTKKAQQIKCKKWRENNKEKIKQNMKKWLEENKEYKRQKDKEYREKNWEKKKQYNAQWRRQNYMKMKTDPSRDKELFEHKIKSNTSRRIREILGQNKSDTCMKYVGTSLTKFRIHLEKTMEEGMSWFNYGTSINNGFKYSWHIDHIIPCDAFDMSNKVELAACFYYKNLRACWWDDNIVKKNSFETTDKKQYMQWFIETVLNI